MWEPELPAWTMAKQGRSLYFGGLETPSLLVSVHACAETKDQGLSRYLTRQRRESTMPSTHGAQGSLTGETGIDSQTQPEHQEKLGP